MVIIFIHVIEFTTRRLLLFLFYFHMSIGVFIKLFPHAILSGIHQIKLQVILILFVKPGMEKFQVDPRQIWFLFDGMLIFI